MSASPTSLYDFATATDRKAIQATIEAGFTRIAELFSVETGEDFTTADIIDSFVIAVQFARVLGDDDESAPTEA